MNDAPAGAEAAPSRSGQCPQRAGGAGESSRWAFLARHASTFLARNLRLAKMSALLAIGNTSRLALEKALLFPLLLKVLSEHDVGLFIFLLSCGTMFSQVPASGVGDALMRKHADSKERGAWSQLLSTGALVCCSISLAALLVGAGLYLILGEGPILRNALLAVVVVVYFLAVTGRSVFDAGFRVELRYDRMALQDILGGVLTLSAIPLAWLAGLPGVAAGFAISAILVLLLQLRMLRHVLVERKLFDRESVRPLLASAGPFMLAGSAMILFPLGTRQILGYFGRFADVTVFFAAETVVAMALSPCAYIANVIYSMIARRRHQNDIPRALILQHCVSSLLAGAAVFAGMRLFGHWVLYVLYTLIAKKPHVTQAAWPLVQILSIGTAVWSLHFLSRGFIYRFGSFKIIVSFSFLSTFVLLGSLLVLVPLCGTTGAAWGLTAGMIFGGLLWFITYMYLFLRKRRQPNVQSG